MQTCPWWKEQPQAAVDARGRSPRPGGRSGRSCRGVNTNGLLRQYFAKGTDLSQHSRERLDVVAAEAYSRPRKALGWETPAERLANLLDTAS